LLGAEAASLEEDAVTLPASVAVPARPEPQPGPRPAFHRTTNVLLVGIDRTRGRALGRADTLILAVFDDATGHVGFVSIPRDLFVEVPGYGPARINATLRIGVKLRKDPLVLLRDVTKTALAVPIQDVLAVDVEMFERGIDRLGGVTVDVPCPIDDNFIDPRTPTGRRLLHVQAGRQRMDGVTAAMYARSRHGRSDWDRARRQQALLGALRARAGEVGVDVWLPIALDTVEQAVTTTMTRLEMLRLAQRAADIQPDKMHGIVIGSRQTAIHWTEDRRAVLVPDYAAIDQQLAGLFRAPSPGHRPTNRQCPSADVAID
jgi:LCP family protein required for cell wall assembly